MSKKNKFIIIISVVVSILLLLSGYFFTKFQDAEIEFGHKVEISDFVKYGQTKGIKVDTSKIVDAVGEYDVVLKYLIFTYHLKAKIKDTTPPLLEVKNNYKPLNYEVDVNDFILKLEDKSEAVVEIKNVPDIKDYGDYPITIIAKDKYNNQTEKECVLSIGWAKKEFSIEVGNEIKVSDLLFDMKDKDSINQKDLDLINKEREGQYQLKSILNNVEVNIKIEKTKDVTPPTLELKKVKIYENRKIDSVKDFIKKAKDKGSKVSVKLLTKINYSLIGDQKIEIEASDIDGNKIVKETKLTIVKDTVGPKLSGLSKITINKGSKIDYKKGVSAYDDNFGSCTFEVDTSGVNIAKYGNYYAVYTSKDKLGNKTTAKRVIVVNHDKTDTDNLVKSTASGISSNAEAIRDYVRNKIKYNTNYGGSDPIWYGLKNKLGNCYVHAKVFEAILKVKGYNTKLIWTKDKTHYWNMVYLNGKWVHMDSTPSSRHNKYSIMNDEQRYERLQGRDWDRSLWPAAT